MTQNPAQLKVDGYIDALNDEGQQFEELLNRIVGEHSYAGEPMHEFQKALDADHPGKYKVTAQADAMGALFVTVETLKETP